MPEGRLFCILEAIDNLHNLRASSLFRISQILVTHSHFFQNMILFNVNHLTGPEILKKVTHIVYSLINTV